MKRRTFIQWIGAMAAAAPVRTLVGETKQKAVPKLRADTEQLYLALFYGNPWHRGLRESNLGRQPTKFHVLESGRITNVSECSFLVVHQMEDTVTHVGVFDSPSGGRMLYSGELQNRVTAYTGKTITFAPGEIEVGTFLEGVKKR